MGRQENRRVRRRRIKSVGWLVGVHTLWLCVVLCYAVLCTGCVLFQPELSHLNSMNRRESWLSIAWIFKQLLPWQ